MHLAARTTELMGQLRVNAEFVYFVYRFGAAHGRWRHRDAPLRRTINRSWDTLESPLDPKEKTKC
jgi:hypothetical protein